MIADNKYNIRQSKPRKDNYLKVQNYRFHMGNNIKEQILYMYLQKTTPSNGNGITTKANESFDNGYRSEAITFDSRHAYRSNTGPLNYSSRRKPKIVSITIVKKFFDFYCL